jgi:hypothetical protein
MTTEEAAAVPRVVIEILDRLQTLTPEQRRMIVRLLWWAVKGGPK